MSFFSNLINIASDNNLKKKKDNLNEIKFCTVSKRRHYLLANAYSINRVRSRGVRSFPKVVSFIFFNSIKSTVRAQ